MLKSWKFYALAISLLVALALSTYMFRHGTIGLDLNNPPLFIQHDFVDLSRIYSISKFRSGAGHDFSGNGETCRSMKHYFTPQYDPATKYRTVGGQQLPPLPDGKTDIPIYSPVTGRIQTISEEHTPIGKQIGIVPDDAPRFLIRLFHIYPQGGIKVGTHLTAGQQIGVIGGAQGTDIAIQGGALPWDENFISYFAVMPDSIFSAYQARGVASRNDFILSKEYRDAHPLQCKTDKTEQFIYPDNYDHTQDEVYLSGYLAPDYGKQQSGSNGQTSSLNLTSSDDGRLVQLAVNDLLTLSADNGATALDFENSYDKTIIAEQGSGQAYQFSRQIKGLKVGQTNLVVNLTPKCALPDVNPRCAQPSRVITLKVTVK